VLTFDDSVASHYSVVRPLLKQYGFSATFFISEGFSFRTNKKDYMTWEQIAELHRDGFEIGNHTRDHMGVNARDLDQLTGQLEAINARCLEHGIPRPISFAYPGNAIHPDAIPVLQRLGIRFARRGGAPERPYEGGRGFAFEPGMDHPLLIPSAGDARPNWTLADFKRAVRQARHGKVAVLQFHGVPDNEHPWVHTPPGLFVQYLDYLHRNGYRVFGLRDLTRFLDPVTGPAEPMAVIEKRKGAVTTATPVRGEILDAQTGLPLACRLSIRAQNGVWYFPDSDSTNGTALTYQVQNWANTNALEMHTTLSGHPFEVELPPGRYTFNAERGKEYFSETREVVVGEHAMDLKIALRRWIDMASRGWFSGDTHAHRKPAELPNVMLAEDLNAAFPMVYWTTDADVPPNRSDRNFKGDFPAAPVEVDATHVYYPRNTEYEIFTTAKRPHTLGALLAINHKTVFDLSALPISQVAERAHAEGALLDLEKHNWPWSMALVPLVRPDLFELANNHHWATEYSITNWAVSAPEWMQIGRGSDSEREWTLYGFLTYYALLDCGFRLSPTAGTANGVHPVPLGFSRVYVHLPSGFSYAAWIKGLKAGRSFVSTGPMLFATVNGEAAGYDFTRPAQATDHMRFSINGEAVSAEPVDRIEVIVNGEVVRTLHPAARRGHAGAQEYRFDETVQLESSGWIAVRCWEERGAGRFRFAHTAPWFVEVKGRPLRPRREEAEFLVRQVEAEIARSSTLLSSQALEEYRRAMSIYQSIARTAK
jgi:peptidoglycan/xylan/chitin deacetylase (PgdA/CDA1 family)